MATPTPTVFKLVDRTSWAAASPAGSFGGSAADARDGFIHFSTAEQVPMALDRAFRTALATRSPCVVVLPHDVQALEAADEQSHEHGVMPTVYPS